MTLASFLYEKANLFNRAIDTASEHSERLAELHENGGNLLKAAQLYEQAEHYDKAYTLYESIRQYDKALECYLQTEPINAQILIHLNTKIGNYEKVIEMHIKSGTLPDLEEALFIATTHKLTSHKNILEQKIANYVTGDERDLDKNFFRAKNEILSSYSKTIGIDFGTTNTVAAIFNKKTEKVEIILTPAGATYVPSYFGVDVDNHPIFGEQARIRSLTAADCVIARVKRSLGEKKVHSIGGKIYRSEEVVANFLHHIKTNAEIYIQSRIETRFSELLRQNEFIFPAKIVKDYLSKQENHDHIDDLVLSVPAYFNDSQKKATRDSSEIARLQVRRLLHEPSAAALAYAYQKQYSGKIAVIDIGGGTLDISIVDIEDGVSDVQTISGDTKLGGSDIDALLVEHTMKDIATRWNIIMSEQTHLAEITRLRDACEELKINLSSVNQFTIELPHFLNKAKYEFTLTRKELEQLSQPILSRIRSTISTTIEEYGGHIDNYILVGNATKMPVIVELIRDVIPAKQLLGIDPGTVVATGTVLVGSVLAGELKQLLLVDVVPYSLGIATIHKTDEQEVISRLIEKNSTIPITKSDLFTTREDNQSNVRIKVYQGEASQPNKNFFLGDFILDEIPPAPANSPQIEVTFDIDSDCILMVSAVDKATGNKRSISIENAVGLSHQEKQNLRHFFAQRELAIPLEKELAQLRMEVDYLKMDCQKIFNTAEIAIKDFFVQFREKIEINPQHYRATSEQVLEINNMFLEKDEYIHGIPNYHDQFATILNNLRQVEKIHLDFSDNEIALKLKERIHELTYYKQAIEDLGNTVEKNVTVKLENWVQILESMEPDLEKLSPIEVANYYLTSKRYREAREILEDYKSSEAGLTQDVFYLILHCYLLLGLKEEYRDTHQKYGYLFENIYPDFNRLNVYFKAVEDSVFMIQGRSKQNDVFFGSGFCIAPNLIVTNRHVVENMLRESINLVGKYKNYQIDQIELDPINDLAILRVHEGLKPLRLGEVGFVEPGDQVLALGFPSPNSNIHDENIYISKGIVNSIRKIEIASERVIFVDAKIGGGMSGGPLINELGEVVGIIAFSQVDMLFVDNQPVALPISLVKKYLPT